MVNMNYNAVNEGMKGAVQVNVPKEWKDAPDDKVKVEDVPEFIESVLIPMNKQEEI